MQYTFSVLEYLPMYLASYSVLATYLRSIVVGIGQGGNCIVGIVGCGRLAPRTLCYTEYSVD